MVPGTELRICRQDACATTPAGYPRHMQAGCLRYNAGRVPTPHAGKMPALQRRQKWCQAPNSATCRQDACATTPAGYPRHMQAGCLRYNTGRMPALQHRQGTGATTAGRTGKGQQIISVGAWLGELRKPAIRDPDRTSLLNSAPDTEIRMRVTVARCPRRAGRGSGRNRIGDRVSSRSARARCLPARGAR